MELWGTALALLLIQTVASLPPGAVALLGRPGAVRVRWTPGLVLRPLRPGALWLAAQGLPFEVGEDELVAWGTLDRLGRIGAPAAARRVRLAPSLAATCRGTLLLLDGVPFVRAVSPADAERLGRLARRLATAGQGTRLEQASRALEDSLDGPAFREAWRTARATTRPARLLADLYAAGAGLAPPLLALGLGVGWETAWRLVLPALAVLHGLTWIAACAGEHVLGPSPGRFERWLVAALYPPALLRMPADVAADHVAGFHPMTQIAALLEEPQRSHAMRAVLGQAIHPRWARRHIDIGPAAAFRPRRVEALLRFADRAGPGRAALLRPPPPSDPVAARFCPVCLDDFRAGFGTCPDCGVATVPYAAAEEPPAQRARA